MRLQICRRCDEPKPHTLEFFPGSAGSIRTTCHRCKNKRDTMVKRGEDVLDIWDFRTPPPYTPDEGDWKQRASCRGLPGDYMSAQNSVAAKQVCALCPVREECRVLVDTIEATLPLGASSSGGWPVWAGETALERIHRRKQAAA